jgi:hypothetical protein
LHAIERELTARGIPFEPQETFKPKKERLKVDLIAKWKIINPGKNENKDKRWKFFKPISDAPFAAID